MVRARDGERAAWLFLAVAADGAGLCRLVFAALRRRRRPRRRSLTAIAARLREEKIAEVALAPVEDPEPPLTAFGMAGWSGRMTREDRQLAGRRPTARISTAYWAKRPSQLRNTAKRRAKAAGLDIDDLRNFRRGRLGRLRDGLSGELEARGRQFRLSRALAEQEGAAGTLRLGVARKDGRPVAVQLWLVENGEASIHKLAYAEDAKEMSPGTILGMAMFRHVIDRDRVRVIDYGTGDDGYKSAWMEDRARAVSSFSFNPRSLRGLIGAARARASALVARLRSR